MRKVLIGFIGILMVFVGCVRIEEYEIVRYKAPNWTSDGKIVFVEDYNFVRDKHTWTGTEGNIKGGKEILTLCEIDRDGKNLRQIVKLAESPDYAYSLGITSTSSAGDWVAIAMRTVDSDHDEIFIVKRDGKGLKNLGEGTWANLAPNAEEIVYQNQGIYIKSMDGNIDLELDTSSTAIHPAWNRDGTKIAYKNGPLIVVDRMGNLLKNFGGGIDYPNWWLGDTLVVNMIKGEHWGIFIDYATENSDTLKIFSGAGFYISPDGTHLIGYDEEGYFIIKRDGSDKWYLKP
jgi:hypothetical protein